jgi:putative addiction module antidote
VTGPLADGVGSAENNKSYNFWTSSMTTLKLTQIGNSVGVILPKEVLARLKLEKGDQVHLIESADGVRLTPHDPNFELQMKAAREVMRSRRNVLRELAK